MSVKTRFGQRVWINMSTLVFDNQRTGHRLLVHLAHDVTEQKKSEELMHKMLDLSKHLSSLGEKSVRAEPTSPLSEQAKHNLCLFAKARTVTTLPALSALAHKPSATTSITSTRSCAHTIDWKQV
jgi:hypothetical protein